MSQYELNKLLREVNRNPALRKAFMEDRETVVNEFTLTDRERKAVVRLDVGELYRLGVHGLILRPFSILHNITEADYLNAIRG